MSYYKEELGKDTLYRAEYVESLEAFLQSEKLEAELIRKKFISPEKYRKDMKAYREKYTDMLGFPLRKKREIPVLLQKTLVAQDKNVNIYRMQFCFCDKLKFYGLWFEQIENSSEKPFVLCLHGGSGTPETAASIYHDSANYNHFIRRMTDKGANVFAPQLLLWSNIYGNPYNRLQTDGKLRQLGGSITAMELYLLQGCMDYFLENGMNSKKVGVAGLSYGGMYALHLAALDTRIKVCYSSSWVCDIFYHSWADFSYKGAQETFTAVEVMALVCPRALVVGMGKDDDLFACSQAELYCKEAAEYYKAFDCVEQFKFVAYNAGHEINKGDEEQDFFFRNINKE